MTPARWRGADRTRHPWRGGGACAVDGSWRASAPRAPQTRLAGAGGSQQRHGPPALVPTTAAAAAAVGTQDVRPTVGPGGVTRRQHPGLVLSAPHLGWLGDPSIPRDEAEVPFRLGSRPPSAPRRAPGDTCTLGPARGEPPPRTNKRGGARHSGPGLAGRAGRGPSEAPTYNLPFAPDVPAPPPALPPRSAAVSPRAPTASLACIATGPSWWQTHPSTTRPAGGLTVPVKRQPSVVLGR